MATPGYDGQVIGRDCNCEDFPCCGHGITADSYRDMYEAGGYFDNDEPLAYVSCDCCGDDVREDKIHVLNDETVCGKCCGCGSKYCARVS